MGRKGRGVDKLIAAAVRRIEDERFLTGRGRFTDDFGFERASFATVVRSPYAHARIRTIAVRAARSMPGVLLVVTGADVVRLLQPIPTLVGIDPGSFLGRVVNPSSPRASFTGGSRKASARRCSSMSSTSPPAASS